MTQATSVPDAGSYPPSTRLGPMSAYPFVRAVPDSLSACDLVAMAVVETSSIKTVAVAIVTVVAPLTLHDCT